MFRSRDAARRAATDADDVELAALRSGAGVAIPFDEALFDDQVSEEAEEQFLNIDIAPEASHTDDAVKESAREDVQLETVLANVEMVIRQREQVLQGHYPFKRLRNGLFYRGSGTLAYEICLAIVHVENISYSTYKPLQVAFERMAGLALSAVLNGGVAYRTGFPPDSKHMDETGSIHGAVEFLKSKMPDHWAVDPSASIEDVKDGGVDTVVFKALDSRPGSLIFVGNCGCGRNWMNQNKHRERPSMMLERVLSMPKRVHLIDFFALPFHVVDERDWNETVHEGRLFLDRLRIANLMEIAGQHPSFSMDTALRTDVRELIATSDTEFKPEVTSS